MENINWKRLIRAIKNEGAILFIGPNLEKNANGVPVYHELCRKLVKDYENEVSFDEKEHFFFFTEPNAKNDVIYDIKEYYEKNDFGHDIYSKIAAIPLHLIVSLSPDDALHNVFDEYNVKHNFAFYDSYKNEVEKPSIDNPLIYNLFGLATKGKYILTQEDYFNYLKSAIGDSVLPQKINIALKAASHFIFIGFDFDKWYIRLLLMILNFHVDKESKTHHAIKTDNVKFIFEDLIKKQFNITFVENDNDLKFITDFYDKIKAEDETLLRKLKSKLEITKSKIEEKLNLIAEYETKNELTDEPREKLRNEKAIEELNNEITELKNTLKTF